MSSSAPEKYKEKLTAEEIKSFQVIVPGLLQTQDHKEVHENLQKLDWLLGKWNVLGTFTPPGMVSAGHPGQYHYSKILNGNYIQLHEHSNGPLEYYEMMNFFTWSPDKGHYVGIHMDNHNLVTNIRAHLDDENTFTVYWDGRFTFMPPEIIRLRHIAKRISPTEVHWTFGARTADADYTRIILHEGTRLF